ncbi:unnamed protein product [Cyclocybe aegerita]|uniref:Uncharacterized protein n=1 Tax=Cyclocybe aegerita TaxID=1973307 RepID=A0A8S0W8E8_CYCAE|nr:unnamed protein product [Cyclocybe aegerita]
MFDPEQIRRRGRTTYRPAPLLKEGICDGFLMYVADIYQTGLLSNTSGTCFVMIASIGLHWRQARLSPCQKLAKVAHLLPESDSVTLEGSKARQGVSMISAIQLIPESSPYRQILPNIAWTPTVVSCVVKEAGPAWDGRPRKKGSP